MFDVILKISIPINRTEGNFIFCLSKIFGVEESEIFEDFQQLQELVVSDIDFINRSHYSLEGKGMLSMH